MTSQHLTITKSTFDPIHYDVERKTDRCASNLSLIFVYKDEQAILSELFLWNLLDNKKRLFIGDHKQT